MARTTRRICVSRSRRVRAGAHGARRRAVRAFRSRRLRMTDASWPSRPRGTRRVTCRHLHRRRRPARDAHRRDGHVRAAHARRADAPDPTLCARRDAGDDPAHCAQHPTVYLPSKTPSLQPGSPQRPRSRSTDPTICGTGLSEWRDVAVAPSLLMPSGADAVSARTGDHGAACGARRPGRRAELDH